MRGRRLAAAHQPPVHAKHRQYQDQRARDRQVDGPPRAGKWPAFVVEEREVGGERARIRVALFGLGGQAPDDDAVECLRDALVHRERGRWWLLDTPAQFRNRACRRGVPPRPEQHVVEDQPERVDVGALIRRLPPRLLGGHVLHGTYDFARNRRPGMRGARSEGCPGRPAQDFLPAARGPRDAEVHDQRLVVGADHDVRGFEVAVHHAGLVGRHETGQRRPGDADHPRRRERAFGGQDRGQVRPIHERHRDVLDAADFPQIVNADNVLVRDLPGEQQLALEATFEVPRRLGVGRGFGPYDFQRHDDAEFGVPRLVHRAHAAKTDELDDVIPGAERLARDQGAGVFLGTASTGQDRPVSVLPEGRTGQNRPVDVVSEAATGQNRPVAGVSKAATGQNRPVAVVAEAGAGQAPGSRHPRRRRIAIACRRAPRDRSAARGAGRRRGGDRRLAGRTDHGASGNGLIVKA